MHIVPLLSDMVIQASCTIIFIRKTVFSSLLKPTCIDSALQDEKILVFFNREKKIH